MNDTPFNEPIVLHPPPLTADEAIALLHATERMRMQERDDAAMKLAQSQTREKALLAIAEQLAEALDRIKRGCAEDMGSWEKYPQFHDATIGGIAAMRDIATAALAAFEPYKMKV